VTVRDRTQRNAETPRITLVSSVAPLVNACFTPIARGLGDESVDKPDTD
jgi:hypothetical protein